ncbi:uncharacterized protein PITG_03541 [Phytophthora infestans T30-4]|uniref:Uncharacterized protein n=1 Tax=Phytophthora infestans (strain T30-4) TaxID=403677 RepID=D0MXV4_PHYIT|nr:uncharacterized protein PITG_03541 [Phytophthora infestans T30-4]EEY66002.1 conserved hypothetical protein [Phytophthora infestans T30-4]|eukprot:XP_002906601.1 conserved hypothetical protein [Phytophthora infestans T30-4]
MSISVKVRTKNKVEVRNKIIRANPGLKQPILPDE